MPIVRWNPFAELETLQGRMNRLFEDSLRRSGLGGNQSNVEWAPPVDVFEDEDKFVVKAEFPGMDEKDINIKVHENVLTVKGEKKLENEEKKDNYHIIERAYGNFSRSFTLPQNVDAEKVEATYKKGVLEIALPKKEETKPREISVKVN